jgi:hypothetical protein
MKIKPNNIIGLAMVIGGSILMAVGLVAVFKIGNCASGGPFVSANPCPAGTGKDILEVGGGITLAVFGIIISGLFALAFGGFFAGVGAFSLIHALTASGGAGSNTGNVIMGGTFLLIGVPTLIAGVGSAIGGVGKPKRAPIDVSALTAGSRLQAIGSMASIGGSAFTPVAPTIMRTPMATPPAAAAGGDPLDKLKELADLKDRGVLSEAEFAAQKAKLLTH